MRGHINKAVALLVMRFAIKTQKEDFIPGRRGGGAVFNERPYQQGFHSFKFCDFGGGGGGGIIN